MVSGVVPVCKVFGETWSTTIWWY